MPMSGDRPPIVATIGLHGSASTWVFDVARELMIAAMGDAVLSLYADDRAAIPDGGDRALVIKSHRGSPGLDEWLAASSATVLLSVRDPRDAALSMATRFNAPLSAAVGWLADDCVRVQHLLALGHPVFRYEDRFFEDPSAASRVAGLLGLDIEVEVIDAVARRYRPDAVRAFTRTIEALPPERVMRSPLTVFDDVTQLHVTHMGDARSGKWRDLPAAVQADMTRRLLPFLQAFEYPA